MSLLRPALLPQLPAALYFPEQKKYSDCFYIIASISLHTQTTLNSEYSEYGVPEYVMRV
jgi:hypothetical protein